MQLFVLDCSDGLEFCKSFIPQFVDAFQSHYFHFHFIFCQIQCVHGRGNDTIQYDTRFIWINVMALYCIGEPVVSKLSSSQATLPSITDVKMSGNWLQPPGFTSVSGGRDIFVLEIKAPIVLIDSDLFYFSVRMSLGELACVSRISLCTWGRGFLVQATKWS